VSVLKLSATLVGIDALACARLIERLFNYKPECGNNVAK